MSNLLEEAELAWKQLFPEGSGRPPVPKEDFIQTAKTEAAWQMWRLSKEEAAQEGVFNIPSYLLSEVELPVENNEMDISELKILRSFSDDSWLQNIGGVDCECVYVKSSINMSQLMCDDDSLGSAKPYYVVGSKVKFPKGVHNKKLLVVYANSGEKINGRIEIDGAIAKLVRDYLIDLYGGKVGKEDVTNNSNSNK